MAQPPATQLTFCKVLEELYNKNLSAMAKDLQLNRATLSRYRSGELPPPEKVLKLLSLVKGVSLLWLEGRSGSHRTIEYGVATKTVKFVHMIRGDSKKEERIVLIADKIVAVYEENGHVFVGTGLRDYCVRGTLEEVIERLRDVS